MNYNVLKNSIAAVIKANGNEEITGDLLQQVLLSMVNILGSGYQFMGAAVPTTNPGTPDARVFYIATQAGTYANFGSPAIELDGTQIAVLLFASSWTSVVLSVPTKEYVDTALALKVDKVEGKGLSTNDLTDALVALIGGAFQKEDIAQDLGDSTTKVVSQAAITAVLLQYAKVDGYYSQLTAGAAENLVGRGSVPASFLRRTTGGTADVGTGSAKIAKLMGNSIVWNQLITSITDSGSIATIIINRDFNAVAGHKYYCSAKVKSASAGSARLNWYGANFGPTVNLSESYQLIRGIYTNPNSNGIRSWLRIINADEVTIDYTNVMVIDLTLMFGAGKEPTTPAEFEALFPLSYYAYEPGKVLPFASQKLVTTGFNQWDEEWENGYINVSTGENIANANHIRSKNYIPVFGNTDYYIYVPGGNFTRAICFYDADNNFISANDQNTNRIFTTPSNCAYIRFFLGTAYGNVYLNDVCINLSWSGYRNGEYEPYELHELVMDPANWEDADGNKIFPYGGMHGFGTARDFATPDTDGFIRKGTRVFARVDLGSLDWTKAESSVFPAGYFFQSTNIPDMRFIDNVNVLGNIVCSKYIACAAGSPVEKGAASYYGAIRVFDSAYSDAATFKAAMSGVYLYYELATPVETELAEPVAASYYANDFGTEEWQPANTDVPYTAPCDMNVAYAMNAVDTLRRLPENYISVGSFENFCTELATKLGAALNKTITITPTYDSEDAEYDYAITIADIEG